MHLRFNLLLGGILSAVVVLGGVFASWLTPLDPIMSADLMNAEMPPGAEFWFGTDAQGRDIYTRVLYGAQVSLAVGVISQLINSFIGTALGVSAGYWG